MSFSTNFSWEWLSPPGRKPYGLEAATKTGDSNAIIVSHWKLNEKPCFTGLRRLIEILSGIIKLQN
jgi:hypothetical protein